MNIANDVYKTKFQSFKEQAEAKYSKVCIAAKNVYGEIGSHCDTNMKDAELWAREAWNVAEPIVVNLWSFSKFIIVKLPVSLAVDFIKLLIRLKKSEFVCEMAKKFAKYTAKLSEKLRRLWQDGKLKQNILSLENKIAEYVSECKEAAKWVYECIKSSLKKQTDANN